MTTHPEPSRIRLAADGAEAEISTVGAEPLAWRVGGRDLLWSGEDRWWGFRAPILFPIVGAARHSQIEVDGRHYSMDQHGFARRLPFDLVRHDDASATFRLTESPETLSHYPFRFGLEVTARLDARALTLDFAVENTGERQMPYGLGFHPALLWPFEGVGQDGWSVVFAEPERHDLPVVGPGGTLLRETRHVPLDGTRLPLSPDLFSEALVFLNSRSSRLALTAPSGAAIALETENFRHHAVWTKPGAPFLSLEAWSAHAIWQDEGDDLFRRDSMTILQPGETGRHRAALVLAPASA